MGTPREPARTALTVNDYRIQASFKFNFSGTASWTPAE